MQNVLLALLAGVVVPIQVGLNAALRTSLASPLWAALLSFAVGTLTLGVICLPLRPWPQFATLPPLWQWLGGVLGALYVTLAIVLAPRLGATSLMALVIAGQLGASLVLDHFGWLTFPQHPATPVRLLGVVLLSAGVMLILRRP